MLTGVGPLLVLDEGYLVEMLLLLEEEELLLVEEELLHRTQGSGQAVVSGAGCRATQAQNEPLVLHWSFISP